MSDLKQIIAGHRKYLVLGYLREYDSTELLGFVWNSIERCKRIYKHGTRLCLCFSFSFFGLFVRSARPYELTLDDCELPDRVSSKYRNRYIVYHTVVYTLILNISATMRYKLH